MNHESLLQVVLGGLVLGTLTALLAWVTYGTVAAVGGMLAFLVVGLLALLPWCVPFVGVPLGIAEVAGQGGSAWYAWLLEVARVESSWMTLGWFSLVALAGSAAGLFLTWVLFLKISERGLRGPPRGPNLALVNCTVIDGTRDGPVVEDAVVLIRNIPDAARESPPGVSSKSRAENGPEVGVIAAVGPRAGVTIPAGYEVRDLAGAYVLPGLINAHSHVSGSGKPRDVMHFNKKTLVRLERLLDSWWGRVLFTVMIKHNLRNALHAGVTTLRSMGDPMYLDVKVRDQAAAGEYLGPRLVCSGQGLNITGGHGVMFGMAADSPAEFRQHVRANLRRGVDCIKLITTGGVSDARTIDDVGRPQMTPPEIAAACEEAHHAGILVGAHCQSTRGIEEALAGGVDTIEHGAALTDALVARFKDNPRALRGYSALVPTLSAAMPHVALPSDVAHMPAHLQPAARKMLAGAVAGFRRAVAGGLRVGVGSDASVNFCTQYNLWRELAYFVHYSAMSPREALYHATLGNAEILNVADVTGSVEPGKSADLIVVAENPLERIEALAHVQHVIIRGTPVWTPAVQRIPAVEAHPVAPVDLEALPESASQAS